MTTNDIWLIAGLGNPEAKYEGTPPQRRLCRPGLPGRQVGHFGLQKQVPGPVGARAKCDGPQGLPAQAPLPI